MLEDEERRTASPPLPSYEDSDAKPYLAIDAVEYWRVWRHANAWGGDAYADWFCYTYVEDADTLADLPPHSFAWRYFPGEEARGAITEDGEPFSPAKVVPLGSCVRCGATCQPAEPWSFNWDDGSCRRATVCPRCGRASFQSGTWEPPAGKEESDDSAAPLPVERWDLT
jgi:hypothetical protein